MAEDGLAFERAGVGELGSHPLEHVGEDPARHPVRFEAGVGVLEVREPFGEPRAACRRVPRSTALTPGTAELSLGERPAQGMVGPGRVVDAYDDQSGLGLEVGALGGW